MEAVKNIRRRPSATFLTSIDKTSSRSDQFNNNGETNELLKDGDDDSEHLFRGSENSATKGASWARRDCSRWLRPFSVAFGFTVLVIIAFASLDTLFHPRDLHLDISNFFNIVTGDSAPKVDTAKIGIDLHPANHVFRNPKTITHHWTITSGFLSPDGVKKEVFMVNGMFPGPTIECRSGDKLIIHVSNDLASEVMSIHWHGLQMRHANSMDGAVGFTQCPIPAGKQFTYEFDIDVEQSGTFWWHAHSHTQRGDGLYGGLVVHKPAGSQSNMEEYGYKKEMLFLIGDWYHRSGEEVLDWYTSVRGFGNEPVPDSLLVNGVGRFVCSMAVPARPVECMDIMTERSLGIPQEATRMRVVNVGTLAGFTLGANSGLLTPITVDGGHRIEGHSAESVGIIYPGERIDMISKWNTDLGSTPPRLRISLDRENFKYQNRALRPDQSFPVCLTNHNLNRSSEDLVHEEPISTNPNSFFDLASAISVTSTSTGGHATQQLEAAQQTMLLYTKTQKLSINSNHPQGFMNRTSWSSQSPPLISLPRTSWDKNQLIPFIPSNPSEPLWVDIVLNNLDDGAHPFHLHGHDFYILASHRSEHGWGSYSPWATKGTSSAIAPKLNLVNPVKKDTVSVPRRGYVVLRFRADNPGIWMFHCHVLFHQASGMAMGLHVGGDEGHTDVHLQARDFCPLTAA